jgi:hypothetical protein
MARVPCISPISFPMDDLMGAEERLKFHEKQIQFLVRMSQGTLSTAQYRNRLFPPEGSTDKGIPAIEHRASAISWMREVGLLFQLRNEISFAFFYSNDSNPFILSSSLLFH